MPELIEQMYCSQQIVIPPKFPYVLKRYAKAAIKTQPYDLLRWSYEYFKALSEGRMPPVKLRLEYPVYSTEGGLTRGYLKVLANQLEGMDLIPLAILKATWQGACLDVNELIRVLCLCEVWSREETVPYLHFVAVAAGLLTKTLTHTMILLCETLTKEPEGGSAAIPIEWFLTMYHLLAQIDASSDVKYYNGYREGETPTPDIVEEEEAPSPDHLSMVEEREPSDEYWCDATTLHKVHLIDENVACTTRLSLRMTLPIIDKLERSPSVERAGQIERENYLRERKGRPATSQDVDDKLREMSGTKVEDKKTEEQTPVVEEKVDKGTKNVEIYIQDEDGAEIAPEFYGEPTEEIIDEDAIDQGLEEQEKEEEPVLNEKDIIAMYVYKCLEARDERLEDLVQTFEDIAALVDRFKSANYDLSMVAGRQMSTTSGEFVVAHIEREMMDYINEQIAILPDPDLKKKKAKPEEVAMIRDILEEFLDENMDVIVPEVEEVEEEEAPLPEVITVYAVPGIGPKVDSEIIQEFTNYALDVSKSQADIFMPRNIRHFLCPPLEKISDHYDEKTV